jgi:group II intron reverse transcriptase/maturase
MRQTDVILSIHQDRGSRGLLLERVYKHLFDPELYLRAYGKIYRNAGAMTKGATGETVDGMCLQKIIGIIELLRQDRYRWEPVRRTEIPKSNGGTRPLGIPVWSDKLVQEAIRALLEPYYEQKFSNNSHGSRPGRGCHTALDQIQKTWQGTTWFIEGDIKGCFDNIDHSVLLEIIRRDIRDERFVRLIDGLLRAGYMEDWRHYDTPSGTPQGGIISPLLSNIYLNELDRWVEGVLIPAYTNGGRRRRNPEYRNRFERQLQRARKRNDLVTIRRLTQERRRLPYFDPTDPVYRRLRYVRYADDFLLGFAGPKQEAEAIRERLGEFLGQKLRLTMSREKTLITHAVDEKAKFLGYEVTVTRCGSLLAANGQRATNGHIALLMPQWVERKYENRYGRRGKVVHRAELLCESEYTIVQRYQAVLRGVYNFYCMATNVGKRMSRIKWTLEQSLTKTLATKLRVSVASVYRRFQSCCLDRKILRAVMERPGKEPLVSVFGGIPFERVPEGTNVPDSPFELAWLRQGDKRAEVVQRMLADRCELCEGGGPVEVHHIRRLADIDRPGRRPKATWEKVMAARKRKTLVVCRECHKAITAGRYDGPRLRGSPESRMR